MKSLLLLVFLFLSVHVFSAIDTVTIRSNAMKKDFKCVVITPSAYKNKKERFPVLYLLHGYGGSYSNWALRVPHLQELADKNNMMIVCPDGAIGSWYFDSPVDSTIRFETYISSEVPNFVDANYRTKTDRKNRAITGLSMGGHGALFIAFRHADKFGACGSMSGALDVSRITQGYGMQKLLGDTATNKKYYNDWSVVNVVEKYPKDSLAIIIDCGTEDFIFLMSKATHDKMTRLKIPHDYIERPGKHDWPYWANAIKYQAVFFREFFKKAGN